MNLNHKEFFNSVVTKGNYALVTGGTNLIAGTRNSGKGLLYNVSPGQPVAYYVENGVATTLDESNLTEAILKKGIHIGVGVDLDNDGLVDGIRLIGQDRNNGCLIKEFRTIAPTCGTPEVEDLLFKDVKCDKTYSALVTVDDNMTRSFAPYLKTSLEFVGSTVYDCADCDSCAEGTADAGELTCQLVDALNNDILLKLKDKSYPDWNPGRKISRPYRAVKLHEFSYVYCFTPSSGTCDECTHVDAIQSVTVNGEALTLAGVTNPADDTQTLTAQLWHLAEIIEKGFETNIGKHSGSAYVTKGVGNCCAIELHINTCDATFAITDTGGAVVPCTTLTPLADTFPVDSDCVDCGDVATTVTYEAGIRIIAAPVDLPCDCYLQKPRNMYTRLIDIDAMGDGWKCTPYRKVQVQNAAPPSNFGSWIQWEEFQQAPGGSARSYSRGNNHQGWLGLPDSTSRVKNAITYADCKKSYCKYYVEGEVNTMLKSKEKSYMTYKSSVNVPQNDTVTKTSIEQFFATIADIAPSFCNTLTMTDCDGNPVVIS